MVSGAWSAHIFLAMGLGFLARHTQGGRESLPFGQLSRHRLEYTCKNFKSFYDNEENRLQPPAKNFDSSGEAADRQTITLGATII